MKSERQAIIRDALTILNRSILNSRPGPRSSGFNDGAALMQNARYNALRHPVCRDCAHLVVKISDGKVGVGCTAMKSPARMWAEHQMIGTFGSEPHCDSFTVIEETSKQA